MREARRRASRNPSVTLVALILCIPASAGAGSFAASSPTVRFLPPVQYVEPGAVCKGCVCDSIFVNGSIHDGTGVSNLRNGMKEKLSHCSEDALFVIEPLIGSEGCSWSRVKALESDFSPPKAKLPNLFINE